MKIQINSKEALERLIGDDKEMEIAIKNAVINQFAKQYLKSVANSMIIEDLKRAVCREVSAMVEQYVEKTSSWARLEVFAKPELKEAIDNAAKAAMSELIKERVKEQMAKVNQEVGHRLNYELDIICDRVSERNIDRLVQNKLRKLIEE